MTKETKTIRFTEDERRMLAKLAVEELLKDTPRMADEKLIDLAKDELVGMSTGLANVLTCTFPEYTLRQLAEVKWVTLGRVKGIGKARYDELVRIFEAFGLAEGEKKVKWDYKKMIYFIE